ncbi:glycosyltransferase family 2 protein [Streptomyces sp. NPDC050549]|uniref:glycosyltransferase family 2 protein n=1 Tax=Streptomyces sp. NPDC050549 TaxID=3155406 RepID=UPI00342FC5B7
MILPARDEEAGVLLALESLAAQSAPPALIVVVVNNSSDRTEEFARRFADRPGVPRTVVFNLPDNPHKKAGALNHAINWLNRASGGLASAAKYLLVMDADTSLHPKFLERARNVMASDRRLGGLSAHHPLERGDILHRCRAGQPPAGHVGTDGHDEFVIGHAADPQPCDPTCRRLSRTQARTLSLGSPVSLALVAGLIRGVWRRSAGSERPPARSTPLRGHPVLLVVAVAGQDVGDGA